MSDCKDARIAELESALLPFLKVALTHTSSYDLREDLVVWRAPVLARSKAVVTRADVMKAKELLGLTQ
jgi:hypothetical protein